MYILRGKDLSTKTGDSKGSYCLEAVSCCGDDEIHIAPIRRKILLVYESYPNDDTKCLDKVMNNTVYEFLQEVMTEENISSPVNSHFRDDFKTGALSLPSLGPSYTHSPIQVAVRCERLNESV